MSGADELHNRVIANLLDQVDALQARNATLLGALAEPVQTPAENAHVVPNEAPFALLQCKTAFDALSTEEKLYTFHLSEACWAGAKICLLQCSYEAPLIFMLLQRLFAAQSPAQLGAAAAATAGVSAEEFRAFLVYAAAFYSNMGNYRSFGDDKILPALSARRFKAVVDASGAAAAPCNELWRLLDNGNLIYATGPNRAELGFAPEACTAYYSANCTRADAEAVQEWLNDAGLEGYNNRLFKTDAAGGDGSSDGGVAYTLRLASAETGVQTAAFPLGETGATLEIAKGDYAPFMAKAAAALEAAAVHAANDEQRAMLAKYASSFRTGSMDEHKDASRHWIRDKGPVVESYIGFIESYRDPFGVRGEWEGFCAVVNKEMSAKFGALVDGAEEMLKLMPWGPTFEKDKFLRPDFTSLEVVAFGSSGVPAGINIPNYDDIRQDEGFKNVSLGNVLQAAYSGKKGAAMSFLRAADSALFSELVGPAFEVQVGLHELLGHGSGKLFRKNEAGGEPNFDAAATLDPETGKPVTKWYLPGQTWDSQFPEFGSSYEECRAECVGIYLSPNKRVLEIFGHTGQEAADITYINWLNMARAGLLGLEYFRPAQMTWGQAHMRARFAILRVMLEAGGGLLSLTKEAGGEMFVDLDRSKIESVGVPAVGAFLTKLQVYKSTADYGRAKALYERYTSVPAELLALRAVVLAKKKPRQMLVQCHVAPPAAPGAAPVLVEFEASAEGMVDSMRARFPVAHDAELMALWQADRQAMQPL